MLAQCGLAVLLDVLRIDVRRLAAVVTVNGYVSHPDPATGRNAKVFVLTVTAGPSDLSRLDLARADPVACLRGLRGQLSARPEKAAPVQPAQLASQGTPERADSHDAGEVNLLEMDPVDFEDLVAELFQAMGMQVMTTARSGDGGVDINAMDPDPIRGGKIVIQVKRYRVTLPPGPVRDLYGIMLHEGATRGILVTTTEPGPSARECAGGKPLTLIGGQQLTGLLARHGTGNYVIR
ncbi:MAG: restriction endonuclease [Streptosporangiaceae bacterium]